MIFVLITVQPEILIQAMVNGKGWKFLNGIFFNHNNHVRTQMTHALFNWSLISPHNIDFREKSGQRELEVLARLRQADPDSKYHCLTLYRSFTHRNHLCLVFESLRLVELHVTVKGAWGAHFFALYVFFKGKLEWHTAIFWGKCQHLRPRP